MELRKQDLVTQADPKSNVSSIVDSSDPLSFKDWYSTRVGITPGQEYALYNVYLTEWYKAKKNVYKDSYNIQVRLNYLNLLKQLQVFFSQEEKEKWYNFVNFNDEREILIAIPYFAKKLKEIALHYIELRDKAKRAKLQYNLGGTNLNYSLELKTFLLDNFSKHENNKFRIPEYIFNNIPELSSVANELVVEVEEIYDDHTYLDQSPTLPVSAYYDLSDSVTQKFFSTKNLTLSNSEWLFSNTVVFSGDNFDPVTSLSLANEYIVKYIGENKLTSSIQSSIIETETYNLNFEIGDNYFLWPGKVYKSSVIDNKRYIPVTLSSLDLFNFGQAGTSLEDSDTIFVKTAHGVQGAWLQNKIQNTVNATMEAYLDSAHKTSFLYPYPGFGLSSDGGSWSGPSLVYNSDFYFLEDRFKKEIENVYWSQNLELTTTNSLKINNTTLVSARAYPHQIYAFSDKIQIWQTPPLYSETVYSGEIQEAWLYRFDKTCLPIAPAGNSVFVWPYERLNTSEAFPTYYPENTFVCNPVMLKDIKMPYSIAGDSLETGDTIYKLKNYQDEIEDAIECAWLSGNNISFSKVTCTEQPSLLLNVETGKINRFVWQGNDFTDANQVFKHVPHQPDCPYFLNKLDFTQHEQCICRSRYFSPFGHIGPLYYDNKGYADFIIQESDFTLSDTIDLRTWRDSVGNSYSASSHFMWYKTKSTTGWEPGLWVTGSGVVPRLRKGSRYVYYRATVKENETVLPPYVLRHNYNIFSNNKFTWVTALKDSENTWVNTGKPSEFTFNQNDIILYKRQNTITNTLTSLHTEKVTIAENKQNIWATYDYITIATPSDPLSFTQQTIYVNYPNINFINLSTATALIPGTPALGLNDILEVQQWRLIDPVGNVTIYKTPGFTFTPLIPGFYQISVTAVTGTNSVYSFDLSGRAAFTPGITGLYTFNNIPLISALPIFQNIPSTTAVPCDVPGFVLETFLYGWDYSTYTQRPVTTPGARPFWAKGNTIKGILNKYKGATSWGTPTRFFDVHNPVNQPIFSDITLQQGLYIEYERKQPESIFWSQPITLNLPTEIKQWCAINLLLTSASTLSTVLVDFPLNIDLVSLPTTAHTPITLTNIVENEPVEIIYNALSPFTWSNTVTAEIFQTSITPADAQVEYQAARPWNQIVNRFNPTVPHAPTLENIYTQKTHGGYFLPNNLGYSLYNAKDYTYSLSPTSTSLSGLFEDATKHFAGRGLTKLNNLTPYTNLKEDATWLKDSMLAGVLAGNVNREVVKKYQKFVPYHSSNETAPLKQPGLVNINSKLTPWGGIEDKEWTDTLNKPSSLVGEYNTEVWLENQILKNTTDRIYNWCTDIYGNQYALYKDIKGKDYYEQKNIPGTLWVRKNSQRVEPAFIALNGVFDTYKSLSLYNELTGNGILKIEVFFDTLYIETTGVVLFEKLNYDYEKDYIFSFVDSTRVISLPLPVQPTLTREFNSTSLSNQTAIVGETWFLPEQKTVLVSICELSGGFGLPTLYELDIVKETLMKVFPV